MTNFRVNLRLLFAFVLFTGNCSSDDRQRPPIEPPRDRAAEVLERTPQAEIVPFETTILGREDAIARYLRTAISKHRALASKSKIKAADRLGTLDPITGVFHGDYTTILAGVRREQKCDSDRTFAVSDDLLADPTDSTRDNPVPAFPRLISVACPEDRAKASEFFLAASFSVKVEDEHGEREEVDLKNLELYAWDDSKDKQAYQFYETLELEDGSIIFEANPTRCEQCHLTPAMLEPLAMRMTPIMNELEQPWTHWNVEPEGESNKFNVKRAEKSKIFAALFAKQDPKGAAPLFERIVRAGFNKVATARLAPANQKLAVGSFKGDFDLTEATDAVLAMLRPVFCIEQVQYISEDVIRTTGESVGTILPSVAIDPGFETAYRKLSSAWTFRISSDNDLSSSWFRLPEPGMTLKASSLTPLEQIPVRGTSDLSVEERLIGLLRILRPIDIIRARALDWRSPAFSDFRCSRWTQVKNQRLRLEFQSWLESEILARAAKTGAAPLVKDLAPLLYQRMMELEGQSLLLADPVGKAAEMSAPFLAVDMQVASRGTLLADLATALGNNSVPNCPVAPEDITVAFNPSVPFCIANTQIFGDLLQSHLERYLLDKSGRDILTEDRNTRICYLTQRVAPEADDVRFLDPNIEARMFQKCCGIRPEVYIDLHGKVFGRSQSRLTSIEAEEKQQELWNLVKETLTNAELACAARAFMGLRNPSQLERWQMNREAPGHEAMICAAHFAPQRIQARPSLPVVDDCVTRSEAWQYDFSLRLRAAENKVEAMERAADPGSARP